MRNILLIGLTFLVLSCGNTENQTNYKKTLSKLIEGKNITKVDIPDDVSRQCNGIELTNDGIITKRQTGSLERITFIPYKSIEEIELHEDRESNGYELSISVIEFFDRSNN